MLLMWRRVSSVWHCGGPGSAAVCIGGSSQAAVTEGQTFQPLCCAGRRHRACQHQRLPPVPPEHCLPGRDLRLVPHVCSAVLWSLPQRAAWLHHEVLVTHYPQTTQGFAEDTSPILKRGAASCHVSAIGRQACTPATVLHYTADEAVQILVFVHPCQHSPKLGCPHSREIAEAAAPGSGIVASTILALGLAWSNVEAPEAQASLELPYVVSSPPFAPRCENLPTSLSQWCCLLG